MPRYNYRREHLPKGSPAMLGGTPALGSQGNEGNADRVDHS
jgi:hypothetical protein